MPRVNRIKGARWLLSLAGIGGSLTAQAVAQSAGTTTVFHTVEHIGFDRPEAWGLKYFASVSLLSGLQPAESGEAYRPGSLNLGLELGWVPALSGAQSRIGFDGTSPENLNQVPVFVRAALRIGLPHKFTIIAAAPPPFHVFNITSHLFAFGLERPIAIRKQWTFSWRGYGQVGSVKGAFTCPNYVLPFPPGSSNNPTGCLGESSDVATLRYAGSEFQFTSHLSRVPKLMPHFAVGGNFIDGIFQVHAPILGGLDETRLWTHGGTFSTTAGVSYLLTKQAAFTVDVFYSPLDVKRNATAPVINDGLFNVRALLSYRFR